MRKIALVNQKGGVGKTTTAVNLSAALARLDRKVLLIDLDPQSNATVSLGVPPHTQHTTSYSILTGQPPEPIWVEENLALIPSNIELAGAEMELSGVIGRETILRDALENLTGFDFVLLDCSPSLGLLSVNALTYVKEIIIPLQCEFLALHGISLLVRTVDLVQKRLNPELHISGVVPCMYDVRNRLARETVDEIENHFGDKVYKSRIRTNVRLAEAPSHGKSIFEYAPESNGSEDYLALAREIAGIEPIIRPERQSETPPEDAPAPEPEPMEYLHPVPPPPVADPAPAPVPTPTPAPAESQAPAPPPAPRPVPEEVVFEEIQMAPQPESDIQSAP